MYVYTTLSLPIYLSVDFYFHFLAIVNNAIINMWLQISWDPDFNSLDKDPEWNFWVIRQFYFLIFLWKLNIVFIVAATFYISNNDVQRAPIILHPHQHVLFSVTLIMAILTGVRWYLIGIFVCIFLKAVISSIFSYTCWVFLYLLWKNVYLNSLPIFNWFICFFRYWVLRVPCILGVLPPYQMYDL